MPCQTVMISQHAKPVAQSGQTAGCPIVEAADIDDNRGELATEQRYRGGGAAPRRELRVGEVLPPRQTRDTRAVGADDRPRARREMPVAAEAQTGLVLAVDDAALIPIPVEATFVLDPL